jgi:hypothetical protein
MDKLQRFEGVCGDVVMCTAACGNYKFDNGNQRFPVSLNAAGTDEQEAEKNSLLLD